MENTQVETANTTGDTSTESGENSIQLENELTIDDILNIDEEAFPEFSEENHKGMKPLNEWLQHVPEDVRKHIANLRSSYTRKTQEIAEMRKEIEAEREKFLSQNKLLFQDSLKGKVDNLAADEAEYDLFDQDGMRSEIQRQAAKMLQEMLKPAQEEIQLTQRRMELEKFKTSHPDMTSPELRTKIADLLTANEHLKLEDAYYIAKSKYNEELAMKAELDRGKTRDVLTKTSTGSASAPKGTPKFTDAWTAYQHFKSLKERG